MQRWRSGQDGSRCMRKGSMGRVGARGSTDNISSEIFPLPCCWVFSRTGLFPSCLTGALLSFVPSGLRRQGFFWRWIRCLQETVNGGLSLFLIRSLQGKTSWPTLLSSFVRACLLYLNTCRSLFTCLLTGDIIIILVNWKR